MKYKCRRSIWNDGCDFNLNFRPLFHQARYLHTGHRREVFAHDFAVDLAQLAQATVVFDAVSHVPSHADHVLGAGVGFFEDGGDVAQGLRSLQDEVVGFKLLLGEPAKLYVIL